MSTVEEAVCDVEELHSKIMRKKYVESKNETITGTFQQVRQIGYCNLDMCSF